ncbi:MAG: hypothetical protein ACKO6L_10620, partial [Flavobacteriales bacterium]
MPSLAVFVLRFYIFVEDFWRFGELRQPSAMMTTITTSKEEKLKAAFHDRVRELLSPEKATSLL